MDSSLRERVGEQQAPAATVVITTRNRKDELRNALTSVFEQDISLDVLVLDDASSDGTLEMVKEEFPGVRLDRVENPVGLIAQRNRASTLVRTPFIVSIDDDAVLTSPDTVRRTLAEFDHALIGAVAMPYVNVRQGRKVYQMAANDRQTYITHVYIGTAHALRTKIFQDLGGYHGFFFREYEEQDYCLRLLDAGYFVRVGYTSPIHHFQSSARVHSDIVFYGERNQILLAWLNSPRFFKEAVGVTWRAFQRAFIRRTFLAHTLFGLIMGYVSCWTYRHMRSPVSVTTYLQFRRLMQSEGKLTLDDLTRTLHPASFDTNSPNPE